MFFTLQPNKFPTNGLRSKRNNRVLKELILSCAFDSTAEAGKVIISLRYLFLSSCRSGKNKRVVSESDYRI